MKKHKKTWEAEVFKILNICVGIGYSHSSVERDFIKRNLAVSSKNLNVYLTHEVHF